MRTKASRRIVGILFVLTVLALIVVLTACGGHPAGPAGKVTDKRTDVDTHKHPKHCTKKGKCTKVPDSTSTSYYLTTQDPESGSTTEFEVGSGTYDACVRGANYEKGKCH